MKRTAIVIHTRPNTNVEFYQVPKEHQANWDELFASGVLLKKEIIMTPLQIIYKNVWKTKKDADDFGNDEKSIIRHKGVSEYNEKHGIIKTLEFVDDEQ